MVDKTVYLDLDGTIVGFVRGALAHHKATLPYENVVWDFCTQIGFNGPNDPLFWAGMGCDFWENLPWTADGKELLVGLENLVGPERIVLLSSPCSTDGCAQGKVNWVRRELPAYSRRLFLGASKHLMASPAKLLVDDYEVNCHKFVAAGGRVSLVPRPWNWRSASEAKLVDVVLKDVRYFMEG